MATVRTPISVCMISGAEEARIGPALASVADWVADLHVVLNAEVQDGTEALCRQYGAQVHREPWRGYIAQMQSAATKATQPWVLALDADEQISPTLRAEIERVVALPVEAARPVAYAMPRITWFGDRWIRHGDWYPDRKIRLWRNGRGRWIGRDPHYHLEIDGAVGALRGDILHRSFVDLAHQLRKINRYGDLYAAAAVAAGERGSLVDLAFRPAWRFFRSYVLRAGFLDGWAGFLAAGTIAIETYVRHAKLIEATRFLPAPTDGRDAA